MWTLSLETCTGMKRSLSRGSHGILRLSAGPGCLVSSAFNVSIVSGAGISSEQIILIAALKFPASSLLVTAAASLLESVIFLVIQLDICWVAFITVSPPSHAADLLFIMLLRFLLTPPLLGLAKMTGPKWSRSLQASLSVGASTIRRNIWVNNLLHAGLAARGMRLINVFHLGWDSTLLSSMTFGCVDYVVSCTSSYNRFLSRELKLWRLYCRWRFVWFLGKDFVWDHVYEWNRWLVGCEMSSNIHCMFPSL